MFKIIPKSKQISDQQRQSYFDDWTVPQRPSKKPPDRNQILLAIAIHPNDPLSTVGLHSSRALVDHLSIEQQIAPSTPRSKAADPVTAASARVRTTSAEAAMADDSSKLIYYYNCLSNRISKTYHIIQECLGSEWKPESTLLYIYSWRTLLDQTINHSDGLVLQSYCKYSIYNDHQWSVHCKMFRWGRAGC